MYRFTSSLKCVRICACGLLILLGGWLGTASAQPGPQYLEVIPISNLDYGVVTQQAGTVVAGQTYPYLGKFKIRARLVVPGGGFPEVDIALYPPGTISGTSGSIPYSMVASTNSDADSPGTATLTNGTTARIPLKIYDGTDNGIPIYSAYAYVFGSINVGAVSSGDYIGALELEATAVNSVPPVCLADAWRRNKRYYPGDIVTHDGAAWEANRFTIGNEPGKAHDWDDDEDEDEEGEEDDDSDDSGGDDEDDDRSNNGNGNGKDDDDDNNGNGDPGGGRPWDLITICY